MQRSNYDSTYEIMQKMPIANQIKIISCDNLQFKFSNEHKSQQFIDMLNRHYQIAASMKNSVSVVLTSAQLNDWLGAGSFEILQNYDEIYPDDKSKIKSLISLSDRLLHIAVLFTYEYRRNGLFIALHKLPEVDLLHFQSRLSYNMFAHLCLLPNSSGAIGLYDIDNKRIIAAFIGRLADDTCALISMLSFDDSYNIFDMLSHDPQTYINFIDRLSPIVLNEACDNALESIVKNIVKSEYAPYRDKLVSCIKIITAENWGAALLKTDPNQKVILWEHVVRSKKYAVHILDKLSSDVCNQLAITKCEKYGYEVGLVVAAAHMNINAFVIFMKKLSNAACEIVINNKNDDKKRLFDIIATRSFSIQQLTAITNKFSLDTLLDAIFSFKSHHAVLASRDDINNIHNLILSRLCKDNHALKTFKIKYPQLKSIEFRDGGASNDLWSVCTSWMFKALPDVGEIKTYDSLVRDKSSGESVTLTSDFVQDIANLTFLRIQGRTVLFEDHSGDIVAYKVQKTNEDIKELSNEFDTNYSLQNTNSIDGSEPTISMSKTLNLESTLARPLSLSYMTGVYAFLQSQLSPTELTQFKEMTCQGDSDIHYVYKYSIAPENRGYFTYLHSLELSDADFAKANSTIIKDLLLFLMKLKIVYPRLADMFHNIDNAAERDDGGRYMVLSYAVLNRHSGTGRLSRWLKAIEFPNLRVTGLADLGDKALLSDYLKATAISMKHFSNTYYEHGRKAGNIITANFIAEYQYVLFLNAGARALKLTNVVDRSDQPNRNKMEKISKIWLIVARQVMMNAIQAVSILTLQSKGEISRILTSIVDVELLARQMQYWMTTNYINNIKNNFIPAWVYGSSVRATVDFKNIRHNTFNDVVGSSIDGINPDLGFVNGQEPIKEANKLFYWMTTLVLNFYSQTAMAFKQLVRLSEIKNPDISQIIRLTLFSYLPAKQENLLQIELCKQLLANAALSSNSEAKIKNELEDRMKMKAAYIFLSFFRNVKYKKEFGLKINRFGMFGRSAPAHTSTAAAAAAAAPVTPGDTPSSSSLRK